MPVLIALSLLILPLLLAYSDASTTQPAAEDVGTALRMAVRGNDAQQVAELLEQGADPDSDLLGMTPLLLAVVERNQEIINLLLQHGANVNFTGYGGGTVLQAAMFEPDLKIIKLLVESGADVNASDDNGWAPLHRAMIDADPDVVKYLLEQGADVDAQTEFGSTPLTHFTEDVDPATVQLLIDYGADVNQNTGIGDTTAMHEAITDISVMQMLLDNGANINARDYSGDTPLHAAALQQVSGKIPDNADDPLDVIRFLVTNGADLEARNDMSSTPLMSANGELEAETATLLVELGANIDAQNERGDTLLHNITYWWGDPSFITVLANLGADTELHNADGNKPIYGAIVRGSTDAIKALLEAGAEVDLAVAAGMGDLAEVTRVVGEASYIEGNPELATKAITLATYSGYLDILDLLLSSGAQPTLHAMARIGYIKEMKTLIDAGVEIDKGIGRGYTALHEAALNGQNDAVRLLVSAGADINSHGFIERTPLERAIRNDHYSTVELLLELGADTEARFHSGGTALHWAAGDYTAAKLLIDAGADVNARTDDGDTPLISAASTPRPDATIVQLLIESGAELNAQDENGWTALHVAVDGGLDENMEPLETLLVAGADPEIPDGYGFTPLLWAAGMDYDPAAVLLLEYGADPNYVASWGGTALLSALSYGSDELAELLREYGAEEPSAELLLMWQY